MSSGLRADDLNRSDTELNALAFVAQSSIRDLGRDSPLPFSQLLRGPTSLGGYLQAEGVRAVPSPGDVSPGFDAYFTGGYNTREHGARSDGEVISGIQIEHHFSGLRDTAENRAAYAAQLARTPRRSAALLGLARAARASSNTQISAEALQELSEIWRWADEPVRKYLEGDD